MPTNTKLRRRSVLTLASFIIVMLLAAAVGPALVSSATPPPPTTSILANRISVPNGTMRNFLLRLPSLGYLYVDCVDGGNDPMLAYWKNSETYGIDATGYLDSNQPGLSVPSGTVLLTTYMGAPWASPVHSALDLGRGVSPNGRRAVHVEISIWRSALNAPCVAQALATSWAT